MSGARRTRNELASMRGSMPPGPIGRLGRPVGINRLRLVRRGSDLVPMAGSQPELMAFSVGRRCRLRRSLGRGRCLGAAAGVSAEGGVSAGGAASGAGAVSRPEVWPLAPEPALAAGGVASELEVAGVSAEGAGAGGVSAEGAASGAALLCRRRGCCRRRRSSLRRGGRRRASGAAAGAAAPPAPAFGIGRGLSLLEFR